MKKTLALLLALALCLSLCACGQAAEKDAPAKSDGAGGVISKPGETQAAEKPADAAKDGAAPAEGTKDAPPAAEATPEPTQEPAPEPAAIAVRDLCAVAGMLSSEYGYSSSFSYTLPEVTGPDTDYLRALNEDMRGLYDGFVTDSLEAIADEDDPPHYCISYYYGYSGGIHSILVTSDSDWGMDQYWCYNFDDDGGEVDNETVLEAVGLTPERFVELARAYLSDETDLSEYGMDAEFWKDLQEKTVSDENCNARMPMVILPDGTLCFIATIYTPAGAGQYDHALTLDADMDIYGAEVGRTVLSKLQGTYLVLQDGPVDAGSWDPGLFLDVFMLGDTLTMEVTGFERESGSVLYYYGVDIFPEDPDALLRADSAGVRVRVVQHCPDVFGGSYYGEPGIYTLWVVDGGIAFTDYAGGTPLTADGENLYALTAYRGDLGLVDPMEKIFGDKFDYDALEDSGLTGIWSGVYRDEYYDTHSVTLELTSWGQLRLRDCVGAQIPRVLEGEYYIAGPDDDMAPEGAVVYALVSRSGYKTPYIGYTWMEVDYDGDLIVTEDPDSYAPLFDTDPDYAAVLRRVPPVRFAGTPEVIEMENGGSVLVDVDADGEMEEIGLSWFGMEDYEDIIGSFSFTLNGEEVWLDDMQFYGVRAWLMVPRLRGAVYLYIDGQSDNDYHCMTVIGFSADDVWYAGDFLGLFKPDPADAEAFTLETRFEMLGSLSGTRLYRLGLNGLPEALEPFYAVRSGLSLTSRQDLDCWTVDENGETAESATLPAGTELKLLRSDGVSFVDLKAADGTVYRVWVDREWPHYVGGVPAEDCFDDVVFAG